MKRHKGLAWFCCLAMLTGCSPIMSDTFPTNDTISYNIEDTLLTAHVAGTAENIAVPNAEEDVVENFNTKEIGAAFLIDETNDETIVSYNVYERIYPASITKVVSGILIAEAVENNILDMDEVITIKDDIPLEPGAAKIPLEKGDQITVKNLIYGYLIRSLNDCGVVLAQLISGSEAAFVEEMNAKAQELGATHSNFVNCHGLHDENHYTTPYDIYLLFKEFASHDLSRQVDKITEFTLEIKGADGELYTLALECTNGFLSEEYSWKYPYEIGAWKSGTTNAAGNCLVMEVLDGEKVYYVLVLRGESRELLYKRMNKLVSMIPN